LSEIGNHALACPVACLVPAQRVIVVVQKHRQRDLAHNPLTTTDTPSDTELDALVADGAYRFASEFGRDVERNAFALIAPLG
jgi:hypothetical protein